ncbi:hypothetical protein ACFSW8_10840 [Rubritalea tangerina]|uniref:Uncharacterized protein n=2 Tax=Rubritalea tangerina TaxID=430798 RepID=A0ABW4ZCS1_9BACT
MLYTIKWTKSKSDTYTSECGTITVSKVDESFKLVDSIEGDKLQYRSLTDAMDDGGTRYLTTQMGNFAPFLDVMKKNGELKLVHQIDDGFSN